MRHPKRRANLLYNLRRKGVECDTRRQTIYLPYQADYTRYCQIAKLCKEFHFNIQRMII